MHPRQKGGQKRPGGYASELQTKLVREMGLPSWDEVSCPLTSEDTVGVFVLAAQSSEMMNVDEFALRFMKSGRLNSVMFVHLEFLDEVSHSVTWKWVWDKIVEHIVHDELDALELDIFSVGDRPKPEPLTISENARMFLSYVNDQKGLRPAFIKHVETSESESTTTLIDHGWTMESIKEELKKVDHVEKSPFDDVFQKALKPRSVYDEVKKLRVNMHSGAYGTDMHKPQIEALEFAYARQGRAVVTLAPGMGKTLIGCVFMKSYRDRLDTTS